MKTMQLPVVSKTYVPEGMSGGNISVSYWYEASEKDGIGKGGVGLFISLSGPGEFSGERAAKFMWDSFLETYLYSEGKTGDVLRSSVKAVQQRLVDLIQHENGVSEQGVDVHLCAFSAVEGSLSMILMGEPGVLLVRKGKPIDLTEIVPSYSGQGLREEISVGAFALESGDSLIVSTPKLVQSFLGAFGDADAETLPEWTQMNSKLDQFSQNLVGNQYLWTLGFDVRETEPVAEGIGIEPVTHEAGDGQGVPEAADEENGYTAGGIKDNSEDAEEDNITTDVAVLQSSGSEVPAGMIPSGNTGNTAHRGQPSALKTKLIELLTKIHMDGPVRSIVAKGRSIVQKTQQHGFIEGAKRSVSARMNGLKLRGIKQRRMVIGQQEPFLSRFFKSKAALLVIFLVLAGCIGLYIWKQSQEQKRVLELDNALSDIEAAIDDAQIGWEAEQNRSASNEELISIKASLDELADDELQEDQVTKKEELYISVQELYDLMDRVTPITEEDGTVEILTDLYLKIGEGVEITDFEKYGEELYITDRTSHAVYRYTPGSDGIEKLADSADVLKSPEYLAIGDGYLFVYDTEVGVVMLDMNQPEAEWVFKIRAELSARTIGAVAEIAAFADSVYLLKSDEARVLKSYPAGAGYSFPEEYFRNGGFDKAVDILIDGNIYVLSDSSDKVYKYFGGTQDSFSLSGLNVPLGDLCCGATNLNDTGKLYLYDVTNKRIVTFEKPTGDRHPGIGVMVKQYVYRGEREDMFTDVREIVVDVDEQNVYVLDGTRILRVSLDND